MVCKVTSGVQLDFKKKCEEGWSSLSSFCVPDLSEAQKATTLAWSYQT
jgi:hypothetical protein